MLLGTSLLYANSGTTNLDGLYIISNLSDRALESHMEGNPFLNGVDYYLKLVRQDNTIWYEPYYIDQCLTVFSVGFLFKLGAAPFHFWSPDVYDQIPTIVTTFVALVAKISIFVMLLELVHYTSNGFFALQQIILSAALDSGYLFITLVGILTSVIGGVYYLGIIKQVFFDKAEYEVNPLVINQNLYGYIRSHIDPEWSSAGSLSKIIEDNINHDINIRYKMITF